MTDLSKRAISRRVSWSVAVIAAIAIPRAVAEPDPAGCPTQLPEEFSSTSFSTTSVAPGTNYSILFSTKIPWGPHIPAGASGYRIQSRSISGTKRDGATFSIQPSIGESGARGFGTPSGSSLGFVVDTPWTAGQLVRAFGYTYTVEFLRGLDAMQTCTYATAMTLADNHMVAGGVGSVIFSPPQLADANG